MRMTVTEPVTQPKPAIDHLSWSGIQAYKQCPRRFYFRYIAKAPEEQTGGALVYGGAIHRAIETVHESRIAGQEIPTSAAMMNAYESAWNETVVQKPAVTFARDEDEKTLREQAKR